MNRAVLVLLASAFAAGCANQQKVATREEAPPPPPVAVKPAPAPAPAPEAKPEVPRFTGAELQFEFNQSALRPESTARLQELADIMRKDPALKVQIAGHADERGTTEYNLSLGNRRADVARKYLVDLGVEPNRIEVLSYGEERPKVEGEGEDVWAQNRRDEIIPQ